jgi:hypothetical protein
MLCEQAGGGSKVHGLMPITGAALSSDPRLAQVVREVGESRGIDYLDDQAVSELLDAHRRGLHRIRTGWLAWVGGTAFALGAVAAATLAVGVRGPLRPADVLIGYLVCAALCGSGLILLTRVHRRAQRRLAHPRLQGYRLVLAAAKAHGVPVVHVPGWLVGANGTSGSESIPLPSFPAVSGESAPTVSGGPAPAVSGGPAPAVSGPGLRSAAPAGEAGPLPDPARPSALSGARTEVPSVIGVPPGIGVPPEPAAVGEYVRLAGRGDWHLEVGALLVIIGGLLVAAYWGDGPAGVGGVALLVLGALVWAAGFRLARRRKALTPSVHDYLRQIRAAQASGAVVPELSEPLRELMGGDDTR